MQQVNLTFDFYENKTEYRYGGTGGAVGAIAPPTFDSSIIMNLIAPPTYLDS